MNEAVLRPYRAATSPTVSPAWTATSTVSAGWTAPEGRSGAGPVRRSSERLETGAGTGTWIDRASDPRERNRCFGRAAA